MSVLANASWPIAFLPVGLRGMGLGVQAVPRVQEELREGYSEVSGAGPANTLLYKHEGNHGHLNPL